MDQESVRQSIPRLQHDTPDAVFAGLGQFLFIQHAEGVARPVAGSATGRATSRVERVDDVLPLTPAEDSVSRPAASPPLFVRLQ